MNKYKYILEKNNKLVSNALESQQKWQKKQIYVYYNSGRPLFNYYESNGHLMYSNPFTKKKEFFIF